MARDVGDDRTGIRMIPKSNTLPLQQLNAEMIYLSARSTRHHFSDGVAIISRRFILAMTCDRIVSLGWGFDQKIASDVCKVRFAHA